MKWKKYMMTLALISLLMVNGCTYGECSPKDDSPCSDEEFCATYTQLDNIPMVGCNEFEICIMKAICQKVTCNEGFKVENHGCVPI